MILKREQLDIPFFGIFFLGLFIPLEWFKSLSYLGLGIFFVLFTEKENFHWKNLLSGRTFCLTLFFLLHLLGSIHSENLNEAVRILTLRLPILLVPLFLYYSRFLEQNQRSKIELTYAAICILAGMIGFFYRIYYLLNIDSNTAWLYSDNLVSIYGLQAVYFGVYLIISSLFLSKALFEKEQIKKPLIILGLVLSFIFIYLLASRTALLSFVLLNGINIFYHAYHTGNRIFVRSFIVAGFILSLLLLLLFPKTINRFKNLGSFDYDFQNEGTYYHYGDEKSSSEWNGLNSRAALWTAAGMTMKDQLFFGSGTGDAQAALRETYKKLNFKLGLQRNFGSHNQYLETGVMLGLVGIVLLLIALFAPMLIYLKQGNLLGFLILLCFFMAFLTEDFLSRNQGVAIFSFFYAYWPSKVDFNRK